jgi:hypothetical protein
MHQHAQSVQRPVAACAGTSQQRRFERIVDDVNYRSLARKRVQGKFKAACPSCRGSCVDKKAGSGKGGVPIAPLRELYLDEWRECAGQRLAAFVSVQQADFRAPARASNRQTTARAAPPAPASTATAGAGGRRPRPAARLAANLTSVLSPVIASGLKISVLTAPVMRASIVQRGAKGKGSLFMRHGDIGAGKTHQRKHRDAGCEIFRRNRKRHIGAHEPMLLE